MAEKLIGLKKKGGGKLKETTLWTNSSPTSRMGSTTITLSDSLSNYQYIAIKYRQHKDNPTITGTVIMSVDDFRTCQSEWNVQSQRIAFTLTARNYYSMYPRYVYYVSDTMLQFGSNGSSDQNDYAIPETVIGVK